MGGGYAHSVTGSLLSDLYVGDSGQWLSYLCDRIQDEAHRQLSLVSQLGPG